MAAIACASMLYACNSLIYDGEGDCSVNYRVKFRYDYNMKFADAFAHEVNVVTLYLLAADGRVVWQRTEQGEALATDGYVMTVDVEPGKYDLLVWCGTTDKGSFSIPETTVGKELTCTLERQHDAGNKAFVTEDLDRLFHGWLPEQTFGETEGTYTYTVPTTCEWYYNTFREKPWTKTSSFSLSPALTEAWIGTTRCCPTSR